MSNKPEATFGLCIQGGHINLTYQVGTKVTHYEVCECKHVNHFDEVSKHLAELRKEFPKARQKDCLDIVARLKARQ